jgi:uncharacterized protein DUF5994
VNGLTGARRLARPVRLTLADRLGDDIDGAWWPHTGLVARELPELIEVLHPLLGEIVDICINWSATEAALDLTSVVTGARWQANEKRRRYRLMAVCGRRGSAKLLVVPHMTPQELGNMVMRCAAKRAISSSEQRTRCEAADLIVHAARAESASWAGLHDLEPSKAPQHAR